MQADSAAKLCDCGHPREAHLTLGSSSNWRKPCAATIHGVGADHAFDYPCQCRNFKEATS